MKEKIVEHIKALTLTPMDHKADCYCGLCKYIRKTESQGYKQGYWDGVWSCIDIINRFKFD